MSNFNEDYEIEKRLHKYWFRVATIAMTLLASTWTSILVAFIFRLLAKK